MNKEQLCAAFCGDLEVREVPLGMAVRTTFNSNDGDAIGFYITRHPLEGSTYRIEDSGLIVPGLESNGVNLDSGQRAEAFRALLEEYGAQFDDETLVLHTEYVSEDDVPPLAMRFIALLLRVRDLELLSPETVENTFREDAEKAISEHFSESATIKFREPVADGQTEFLADAIIRPKDASARAAAVYFATTDSRVDEAVLLWMDERFTNRGYRVILLLEKEKPPQVGGRPLRRAMNRLEIATFRGDEIAAMLRIGSIMGLAQPSRLH